MLVAISGWTLYLIQMDAAIFNDPEGSAMQKWITWLGIPIAGVVVILLAQSGLTALAEARGASRAEDRQRAQQASAAISAKADPRHYVLEVIGLGVSLDKHRQGKLWDALQKGNPFTTIREMDPEKYPYSATDKLGTEGGGAVSALENGIRGLPMYWPAPSFYATEPSQDPERPPSDKDPVIGIVAGTDSNGLRTMGTRFSAGSAYRLSPSTFQVGVRSVQRRLFDKAAPRKSYKAKRCSLSSACISRDSSSVPGEKSACRSSWASL